MNIRLVRPQVGKEELAALKDVIDRAWMGNGPKVKEFERAWSTYLGCADSAALNSGTAALHLALWVYGFPRGKKVLVPAMTFAATATAPMYNGLEPVFVDVTEETLQIDMEDLEKKYDHDCVAVIPVHFGGHPAPVDRIVPWARRKGLKVIGDCAHCAGGDYKGKKLGTWEDVGCFSFEEKKLLATGDGGMVSSNDAELIRRIRGVRQVGMSSTTWDRSNLTDREAKARAWQYDISDLGYKYNMNDLAAALGLVQLKKLDAMNSQRKKIVAKYLHGIKGCRHVRQAYPYDSSIPYYDFMVRVKDRDQFIMFMNDRGIATGVHTMPLPLLTLFKYSGAVVPTAMRIWEEYVILPLFASLTAKEIDYIIEAIMDFDRNIA